MWSVKLHPESGVGQDRLPLLVAARVGVGPEVERQAHRAPFGGAAELLRSAAEPPRADRYDAPVTFNLAVIGGDGIGPGGGRGRAEGARRGHRSRSVLGHTLRSRREPLAADRRGAARLGAGRAGCRRRDPARRGRRGPGSDRRAQRSAGAWPAAQAALRLRPLRQPAAQPAVPRRTDPAGRLGDRRQGDRLRGGARGHRGPVLRQRRRGPDRYAAGDRHRGQREHRVRGGAGCPGRVRARRPAPEQAHLGAQAQRAGQRRRAVEPGVQHGRRGLPGRSAPTTCTWTRRRSSWPPTRPGST